MLFDTLAESVDAAADALAVVGGEELLGVVAGIEGASGDAWARHVLIEESFCAFDEVLDEQLACFHVEG